LAWHQADNTIYSHIVCLNLQDPFHKRIKKSLMFPKHAVRLLRTVKYVETIFFKDALRSTSYIFYSYLCV